MRVVTGKTSQTMAAAEFRRFASGYATCWLDVGAGDGALSYRLAGEFPNVLCLGLDPNAEAMATQARRARRKPDRGGRANCLYVAAAVEAPPAELAGLAGAITINFPWARLLEIVLGASDDGPAALGAALATARRARLRAPVPAQRSHRLPRRPRRRAGHAGRSPRPRLRRGGLPG